MYCIGAARRTTLPFWRLATYYWQSHSSPAIWFAASHAQLLVSNQLQLLQIGGSHVLLFSGRENDARSHWSRDSWAQNVLTTFSNHINPTITRENAGRNAAHAFDRIYCIDTASRVQIRHFPLFADAIRHENSLAENAAADIKSIYSNDFYIYSQLMFKSRISSVQVAPETDRFAAYKFLLYSIRP